ncbi:hypothetical protein DMB42_49425 [Nonomuraea sp. WAC 01424]|nr:hypothetical protein DMB42_49425 [Nonomuraea sp. WAC 01424]
MPEVIDTGGWLLDDAGRVPASVAIAHAAVDILHNQSELPGFARTWRFARSVRICRPPRWLTARADMSSDDLAVIRHALTAVPEVKVRA